jgi:hypothetical protein
MKGYHVRQHIREFHILDEFEIYCQLLSVLYWKKHYGDIGLVTDYATLQLLEPYKFLHEYSNIDTDLITYYTNNVFIDKYKFWCYAKIITAAYAPESEFCIIDTDAYLRHKLEFDSRYDFIAAHAEQTNVKSAYPALNMFLEHYSSDEETLNAVNTSILYCNNPLLMRVWHKLAEQVSQYMSIKSKYSDVSNTQLPFTYAVTVEQRFLPIVAKRLDCKYTTLINNVFVPGTLKRRSKWIPNDKYGNMNQIMNSYFHIWGTKVSIRTNLDIRRRLYLAMTADFQRDFPEHFRKYYAIFDNLHNHFSTAWLYY